MSEKLRHAMHDPQAIESCPPKALFRVAVDKSLREYIPCKAPLTP